MNPKDAIIVIFSKEQVRRLKLAHFLKQLGPAALPTGPELATMMGKFQFLVDGWNDDPQELYAIPEVRKFYRKYSVPLRKKFGPGPFCAGHGGFSLVTRGRNAAAPVIIGRFSRPERTAVGRVLGCVRRAVAPRKCQAAGGAAGLASGATGLAGGKSRRHPGGHP